MIITSDKGLAGSFNSAVIRAFEKFARAENLDLAAGGYSFIAIGQKARQYLERRRLPVVRSFVRAGDYTERSESDPIAEFLIEGYIKQEWDVVITFSTVFVTALRQDVLRRQLLPISAEMIRATAEELIPRAGRYSEYLDPDSLLSMGGADYLVEPSPQEVLQELAPELLKIRLYHWLMESNASEHSARRLAMKNASDNASELSEKLNLDYNKSRQAAVTNEIIEVTSGTNASQ